MANLTEKIEASAAHRLSLAPGRLPAEELARYQTFLKVETHRLKILHRAGANGREICQARATLVDLLLRYMWDAVKNSLLPQLQKEFTAMALVAVGGYGRAELNPQSDIDFMFLHEGQVAAGSRPSARPIQADGRNSLSAMGPWAQDRTFGTEHRGLRERGQR